MGRLEDSPRVVNAFFRYGDPRREAVGVRLLQYAAALLREQLGPVPALTWIPPGPGFDYADSPYLFGTRRGYGPLHIVWDTNFLIDYFRYSKAVWEFGEVPARADDELEAFQILTALWVVRDIRFHVLPRVMVDAKNKQLSPERRRSAPTPSSDSRRRCSWSAPTRDPLSPVTGSLCCRRASASERSTGFRTCWIAS